MPNRLADESSPYLLQHRNNPVAWQPWDAEALAQAKREQRPIFLSIGYSACHWCHVMEHESFENAAIAELLNERFVCIKVDREERPDLDQIYMNAVQMLTGRGGWPMSVFLTPDLQPFYGGTYWPPHDSRGMPGFDRIITAVHDAWTNRREQAIEQARMMTEHLQEAASPAGAAAKLEPSLIRSAATKLERSFDFTHGGFGSAPKFPHSMDLQLLLRYWKRDPKPAVLEMVKLTLDKMAGGGIYDHLAGGFARYSVDERWLVPHFEKMLYDNALLTLAYLEAFVATGESRYAAVARETLDYILTYMTDPLGGFYSTEDADSEGVEGKFYVWTPPEIHAVLGKERGERFCNVYDVTDGGNFEHGLSILNLPKTIAQYASLRGLDVHKLEHELSEDRAKLLAVRDGRIRPGKDDKILVSWNGLMIDAMARAAGVLFEPTYLAAASKGMTFVLANIMRPDGRLLHSWRNGVAKLDAYLDDYTYVINALVSLYEASFESRWIDAAIKLADIVMAKFADPAGGFFFTADDHEKLLTRNKDLQDSSVPSGNSMAAYALQRLGRLTDRRDYLDAAFGVLTISAGMMEQYPTASGQMLLAADMHFGPSQEWVLVGDPESEEMRRIRCVIAGRFRPNIVVACAPSDKVPASLRALFQDRREGPNGEPSLYICENHACEKPLIGVEAILDRIRPA